MTTPSRFDTTLVVGLVCCVFLPPLALVIGGVMVVRGDVRGWWIVATSILLPLLALLVVA